jgi:hypothetical protein
MTRSSVDKVPRRLARWQLGLLTLAASFGALAAPPESAVVKSIGAVWDLTAQPCNGGPGNVMDRDPNQARIQASKVVELPGLGVRFRVPQLPDTQRIDIKLFMGDRSRGVTDNYVLLAESDLGPPIGALVVTELPAQFDTSAKVLAAVETLETQLSRKAGVTPDVKRIAGPYGEAIEILVNNRVGTYCFPTSEFRLAPVDSRVRTVGISRFVFTMGKLVEFALIVNVPHDVTPEDGQALARKIMDGYWLGLKPL